MDWIHGNTVWVHGNTDWIHGDTEWNTDSLGAGEYTDWAGIWAGIRTAWVLG